MKCLFFFYPKNFLLDLALLNHHLYQTFYQLFLRIRNIAEHAGVISDCDDFNNARTTYANILERALVAPYYVNYHLEHHLLMFVPCYKLKRAHQMLLNKGFKEKMEIKTGYISLLKSVLV